MKNGVFCYRRSETIVLLIVIIIISIIILFKAISVDRHYEDVKVTDIIQGTPCECTQGVTMKVNSSEILSRQESIKKYGDTIIEALDADNCDFYLIIVNTEFENVSDNEVSITYTDIRVESDFYENGLVPEIYYIENNDYSMGRNLKAGETCEATLGYVIYDFQFTQRLWRSINNINWYLVRQVYPNRTRWEI